MKYHFIDHPSVKGDILAAAKYYKAINPKLAKQFLTRIREAKAHIIKSPEGFQVKHNVVRTVLLRQFPYHLHYLIDSSNKRIVILAIIHAYKNPQDYSDR